MGTFNVLVIHARSKIKVDTDRIPDPVYREIFYIGLKELVNRGMARLDPATRQVEAVKVAEANIQAIYENKIRYTKLDGWQYKDDTYKPVTKSKSKA